MIISRSSNFILKGEVIVWAVDINESFDLIVLLFRYLFEVWVEKGRNKNIVFWVYFWDWLCLKLSRKSLCRFCLGLLMVCLRKLVRSFVFEFLKWVKARNISVSALFSLMIKCFSRSSFFWICNLWASIIKCWLSWESKVFLQHFMKRGFSEWFICRQGHFSK